MYYEERENWKKKQGERREAKSLRERTEEKERIER